LELPIHVAHPNQGYHFAKSKRFLPKTDKIDAKILALFGMQGYIAPSTVKDEFDQELKELMRRK
jgi:transposase